MSSCAASRRAAIWPVLHPIMHAPWPMLERPPGINPASSCIRRRRPAWRRARSKPKAADPDSGAWRPSTCARLQLNTPRHGTARLSRWCPRVESNPRHALAGEIARRWSVSFFAFQLTSTLAHWTLLLGATVDANPRGTGRTSSIEGRKSAMLRTVESAISTGDRSLLQHRPEQSSHAPRRVAAVLIWALLVIIAAGILNLRARHLQTPPPFVPFLPRRPDCETQRLLIEQLRTGPAARLILVRSEGAVFSHMRLARLSVHTRPGAQVRPALQSRPHATPRASSGIGRFFCFGRQTATTLTC